MVCMKSYAERLAWAMKCAGLDPMGDQSRLAAMIGPPCKPQNIQHLLDPNKEVEHSKYTLDIARVLRCDPFWLGRGKGVKPVLPGKEAAHPPYKYPAHEAHALLGSEHIAQHFVWPFKSFSIDEFNSLDSQLKANFEAIILASVKSMRARP